MRILAVDAGNSRIKWGVWEDEWSSEGSVPTAQSETLVGAWSALPLPNMIYASSVAGAQVRSTLDRWAAQRGGTVNWLLGAREQCGVRNSYREPTQLGADRWSALIAAWHLVKGAALVVNAGTAVTIDALSSEGVFLGGVILPGLTLMSDALAGATAGLPQTQGDYAAFPNNTADAIATGALLAVCGAIDRMRERLRISDTMPQIILSGGAAASIEARLEAAALSVPNLVLEGLRIVALEEQRG